MELHNGIVAHFGIIDNFDSERDYEILKSSCCDALEEFNCISIPDALIGYWYPLIRDLDVYFCYFNRPGK